MNDNRARASIGAGQPRTPTGIQHRGEVDFQCADCGLTLMKCLITRNNHDLVRLGVDPVTTPVQVKCGVCGGNSYVREVEGCFHPGAAADDIGFDLAASEDESVTVFRAWRKGPC